MTFFLFFSQTLNWGLGSSRDSAGVSRVPHLYASSAPFLFQRSRKSVAHTTLKSANTTQQMSRLVWNGASKAQSFRLSLGWTTWSESHQRRPSSSPDPTRWASTTQSRSQRDIAWTWCRSPAKRSTWRSLPQSNRKYHLQENRTQTQRENESFGHIQKVKTIILCLCMTNGVFFCQPKGCFSHTAWTQDFISWLRILCSCRGNTCRMTPRALSSGTADVQSGRGSG